MAARKDGLHSERVRQRIKLSQLVTRLQMNSLGEIVMTPGQIETAKFLVGKAMSNPPEDKNLNLGGSVEVNHTVEFLGASAAAEEA